MFAPEVGREATALTDSKGEFVLTTSGRPGVSLGKSKVVITKAAAPTGGKSPADMKPEDLQKMSTGPMPMPSSTKPALPTRYQSPTTSPLEAVVENDATQNVFEFNLVD